MRIVSRLLVTSALTVSAGCGGQGYGSVTHTFGPGLQDTETYTFVAPGFEACSGCTWFVGVETEVDSGSYADGFGYDPDLEALSMYTTPGSGIDDVRSGWGPYLDRGGLEELGYTFQSTFTEEVLDIVAEKPSFAPNRCEGEPVGAANQIFDLGPAAGSVSGVITCGQFATHTVEVPASETVKVWVQTEVPVGPTMYLGHDGCVAGTAFDAVPCSSSDPYDSCPAMSWRAGTPTSITLVIDTFGWTCPDGVMPYTLSWSGAASSVGASSPTDDPSPIVVPYLDTFTVDFALTGSAP